MFVVAVSDVAGETVMFWILGAAAVIAIALALRDEERVIRKAHREAQLDPDLSEHVYRLRVLDTASPIVVARTADAWPRLAQFLAAEDEIGVAEMYDAGTAMPLPAETKVRRISSDGDAVEVRVEYGEHAGDLVWVLGACLTKDRPQA